VGTESRKNKLFTNKWDITMLLTISNTGLAAAKTRFNLLISGIIIFIFVSGSIGCASYEDQDSPSSSGMLSSQMNSSNKDELAAKLFTLKRNKASIYIYRNGLNSDLRMPISLDGKLLVATTSQTFVKVTVDPGFHEISSTEGNFSAVAIKTKAGNNYFIFQEIITDINTTAANLQIVDDLEGQAGVEECRLILSQADVDVGVEESEEPRTNFNQ